MQGDLFMLSPAPGAVHIDMLLPLLWGPGVFPRVCGTRGGFDFRAANRLLSAERLLPDFSVYPITHSSVVKKMRERKKALGRAGSTSPRISSFGSKEGPGGVLLPGRLTTADYLKAVDDGSRPPARPSGRVPRANDTINDEGAPAKRSSLCMVYR